LSSNIHINSKIDANFYLARGGCFIEGERLRNAFRWKNSVGPWEQRPGHFGDVWNYWTDDGFGYFEGLQVSLQPSPKLFDQTFP